MRAPGVLVMVLAATACHPPTSSSRENDAGTALEAAATRTGLIVDPRSVDLAGAWARDTDRVCAVPTGRSAYRIGVLIDYGPGQGCAASGEAMRHGEAVDIRFGDCRFTAKLAGDRLIFPASVPDACDAVCAGRASLAALSVDHLSASLSEAATLRAPDRTPLCPG